ncbi:MAG TPA: hypothetical protein VJ698_11995 [Noviherbaspirillum sp.]|uniref:hypothetical protein n=1 Tax=Noviherbaspirillum sp. TaxID=1926288 RepID=UPI002B4A710C|nr:hypothetical protein [Noviherbaspirillum sp.]HJV86186.1 hypothetical protein [Noviherbaspirillum sp.]
MLFLKSTSLPVAPGVYVVDVAAKPPGKTYMIYAALDAGDPPAEFIKAMEGMGFRQVFSKPYTHHDGKKIIDLHFQKPGTDIFEGWTNDEREANLKRMEEVLAGFGITVQPRVMSLAEAFH